MKFSTISIIAFAACTLFTTAIQAQSANSKKYETVQLKVKGVCGMCQSRIELVTYDLKGVQSAQWDLDSEILTAVVRKSKVTKRDIADALAAAGHTSEMAKAKPEAYKELPACCKYDDGVKKHGGKNERQ